MARDHATLALYQAELGRGDRIGLLGIGSGLNTLALKVTWWLIGELPLHVSASLLNKVVRAT